MTRVICQKCQLPIQRCYCDLIMKINNQVEVIVWQHPTEANHPKGTAKLLCASLLNCQLLISEQISESDFFSRIGSSQGSLQLLFPGNTENDGKQSRSGATSAVPIRLLVLDGTWRKTRRILYHNPWLQSLPRISIETGDLSHYRIRKAEQPGQLSTLEATCSALEQIEQTADKYQPLRQAFSRYIDKLESNIPRSLR